MSMIKVVLASAALSTVLGLRHFEESKIINAPGNQKYEWHQTFSTFCNTYVGADLCRGMMAQNYQQPGHLLGEGINGGVEVIKNKFGQEFALKSLDKQGKSKNELEQFRNEVEVHLQLNHPNIVQLHQVFETPSHILMVMEKLSNGDVKRQIETHGKYSEENAKKDVRMMLEAVKYLHRQGFMHRDIKTDNFVYDDNWNLKMIDFGFTVRLDEVNPSYCGTTEYLSPEVLALRRPYLLNDSTLQISNGGFGVKSDMWSVGVSAYWMLTGRQPFQDDEIDSDKMMADPSYLDSILEMEDKIVQGLYDIPQTMSISAENFLKTVLVVRTGLRYSAREALLDPWVVELEQEVQENVDEKIFAFQPNPAQEVVQFQEGGQVFKQAPDLFKPAPEESETFNLNPAEEPSKKEELSLFKPAAPAQQENIFKPIQFAAPVVKVKQNEFSRPLTPLKRDWENSLDVDISPKRHRSDPLKRVKPKWGEHFVNLAPVQPTWKENYMNVVPQQPVDDLARDPHVERFRNQVVLSH